MAKVKSGVFPVFDLDFKIGTKGKDSTEQDMVTIKDMETFSLSIEGNTSKWNPMDMKGWGRALMKMCIRDRAIGEYEASVKFGEYGTPTFDKVVETVVKAKQGGVMSVKQSLKQMYGAVSYTHLDVYKRQGEINE